MIIFDLGGVLLKEAESNLEKAISLQTKFINNQKPVQRIFNRIFEFVELLFGKEVKKAWLLGKVKPEVIVQKIKNEIHKPEFDYFFKDLEEKNLIDFGSEIILLPNQLTKFTELIHEGYEFIKKCKKNNLRCSILSNWDPQSFHLIKIKFPELFSLFDESDIFIPAKIGYLKPEKEIYQHVIDHVNSPKENIFFIDDSLSNIEGAKKIGIKSIWHCGDWQKTEINLRKEGLKLRD